MRHGRKKQRAPTRPHAVFTGFCLVDPAIKLADMSRELYGPKGGVFKTPGADLFYVQTRDRVIQYAETKNPNLTQGAYERSFGQMMGFLLQHGCIDVENGGLIITENSYNTAGNGARRSIDALRDSQEAHIRSLIGSEINIEPIIEAQMASTEEVIVTTEVEQSQDSLVVPNL